MVSGKEVSGTPGVVLYLLIRSWELSDRARRSEPGSGARRKGLGGAAEPGADGSWEHLAGSRAKSAWIS